MDDKIQKFIEGKHIAILGASRTGKKFGNIAFAELKKRGYEPYLVHPEAKEIDGEPCYPNLAALSGRVDGALISVPPKQAEAVLREAAAAGIKQVWMQQGAESAQALKTASELGTSLVTGKCILMYASPVRGMHGFHRGFMKLFGQL